MEQRNGVTRSGGCVIREKSGLRMAEPSRPSGRPAQGQRLMRNILVASALVLCAVSLRAGGAWTLPTDAVLTAATGDTLLNDRLGRLSFVSAVFPRATLVFGESGSGTIAMPVMSASLSHTWTADEPYITWQAGENGVYACMEGEIRGVYHGNGEELLVRLGAPDGLVCVYGNLAEAYVQPGDAVRSGDLIGRLADSGSLSFEVMQDGYSMNPASLLPGV